MTYIISTDKGFKLLKELPEEPLRKDEFDPEYIAWFKAYQQAIDSAPFIKNEEVAKQLIFKLTDGWPIRKDHSYEVDVSDYLEDYEYDEKDRKPHVFVILTPKAVENKQCTKPNCDCVQKEMDRLGVEGVKSYPCLKQIDDVARLKSSATENSAQVESQEKIHKGNTKPISPTEMQGAEPLINLLIEWVDALLKDDDFCENYPSTSKGLQDTVSKIKKTFILTRKGEAKQ